MLDLEKLGKPTFRQFNSVQEEKEFEFAEAAWWIGIRMGIEEIHKFVWCQNKAETNFSIINADKYNSSRKRP